MGPTPDSSSSWGEPTTPELRITSFLYTLKGLCQENKGYIWSLGPTPNSSSSWGEPTTPELRITSFLYMLKGLCHEK
jgi:hypothetical protein